VKKESTINPEAFQN